MKKATIVAVTFFVTLQQNKKKNVTAALLPSPSLLCCNKTKRRRRHGTRFKCFGAPSSNALTSSFKCTDSARAGFAPTHASTVLALAME